jgi:flagellar hook-basal body complex protein FliE
MSNLGITGLGGTSPAGPAGSTTGGARASGDEFAAMLRDQLHEVSRIQSEADKELERLMTGQTDSITDALVSARKADVAFSLLMEIRNKLVDAYTELQNMRV